VLLVDVVNLSGAEFVTLTISGPVLAAGTSRQIVTATYFAGEASPHTQSPPVVMPQGGSVTLLQTGGTARAFPWAVITLD
jgi:hypothetical protein